MKTIESLAPGRFHVSHTGDLMSSAPGISAPVRPDYAKHFRDIESGRQLRACLRAGESTFPGCYPLFFVTSDGCALSFDSVRENLRSVLWSIRHKANDGWKVETLDVNHEDGELTCEHSGQPIPAAYV